MTERCMDCGHSKNHHHKYIRLTIVHYGHCYYPSKKAKVLECNCTGFVKEIGGEQK